jgi:hypothetical protein
LIPAAVTIGPFNFRNDSCDSALNASAACKIMDTVWMQSRETALMRLKKNFTSTDYTSNTGVQTIIKSLIVKIKGNSGSSVASDTK